MKTMLQVKHPVAAVLMAGLISLTGGEAPAQTQTDFATWLDGVRAEALQKGIGADTLDAALAGIAPVPRVLELDRHQPEFSHTFWSYLDLLAPQSRVTKAREMAQHHAQLLYKVSRQYGVQSRFLVAFWGLESSFGKYTGSFPVISSVATLAHDERRAAFFRAQLFDALSILDDGHIALSQMKGSWAGAMGQLQFIPSTFVGYATDGDGDDKIDIWNSLPDVFSSAANYLSSIGWNDDETWGREVTLPDGFDLEQADLDIRKPIGEWQALGVRRADGTDLPVADIEGSILLPSGIRGPAFLVYNNFRVIMQWNASINYALAIGYLSDRVKGQGPLLTPRPANIQPLLRNDVLELQRLLNAKGYDTGTPDGIAGPMTRKALKRYQKDAGLPPDGYPSIEVLSMLRGEGG